MPTKPKLSTVAACRVARLDRGRFNEHVFAGHFACAPQTIPGRARYFDPDDMVALWLFRELLDDGYSAHAAGYIACSVANAARENPDAPAISYVQSFNRGSFATPTDRVPAVSEWGNVTFSGSPISKVTTFNIVEIREVISKATEEERSYIGPEE